MRIIPSNNGYRMVWRQLIGCRLIVIVSVIEKLRIVAEAGAHHAVVHHRLLHSIDVFQIVAHGVPLHVVWVVVVVRCSRAGRSLAVRLPILVTDSAFQPTEVSRSHSIITTLMHFQTTASRGCNVIIVVLIKPVPPIQMIFCQVRFTGFAGCSPDIGHQQISSIAAIVPWVQHVPPCCDLTEET